MSSTKRCLKNLTNERVLTDSLHKFGLKQSKTCSKSICAGSQMAMDQRVGPLPDPEKLLEQATEFIIQYYNEDAKEKKVPLSRRMEEVEDEIEMMGTYNLTKDELEFATKTAWRNAPRCPGRIAWKNLHVQDCRHVEDLSVAFKYLCRHIKYSTNGGNIQPTITLFAARRAGQPDVIRVWNKQLLNYAGYEQEDGTVIGDKGAAPFTKFCEKLGWKGKNGMFDILPIVLSGRDQVPHFFEIPEDIIMRVKIRHPTNAKITAMNLEWFVVPAVASMLLEVGGLQFPGAPFSGWYSLPEIATRNFLDVQRYNLMEQFAQCLDLDTSTHQNLWKDRVNYEINLAVLHSFNEDKVTLVDHHTQSEQFMEHFNAEHLARGGCPSDWVWIIPPEGGSLTECFHQEMFNYSLSPYYYYQEDLWAKYRFGDQERARVALRSVLYGLLFSGFLMKKQLMKRPVAFIVYATETGRSKSYAEKLSDFLSLSHNVQMSPIDRISLSSLVEKAEKLNDPIFFFVASTFGNGAPPTDAQKFTATVKDALQEDKSRNLLKKMKYAVLGLGSSRYPLFAAYGKFLDAAFDLLGGERQLYLHTCDEVSAPLKSLEHWFEEIRHMALINGTTIPGEASSQAAEAMKKRSEEKNISQAHLGLYKMLEVAQGEPYFARVVYRHSLVDQQYILIRMAKKDHNLLPGDLVAVFPRNEVQQVRKLLALLPQGDTTDQLARLKIPFEKGALSQEEMITLFYDITSVPKADTLLKLADLAQDAKQKEQLKKLATDSKEYAAWAKNCPDLQSTIAAFPSIALTSSKLFDMLKPMAARWYSVSSSDKIRDGKDYFDLVFRAVEYTTPNKSLRKGLCTNYLRTVPIGSELVCVSRNQLCSYVQHLDEGKPTIMIGAGAGIAPFRGVWQQLITLKTFDKLQAERHRRVLLFGCQTAKSNLFDHESMFAVKRITAYSRAPDKPKKYVQELIMDNQEALRKLIFGEDATIIMCGSVAMAEGTREGLKQLVQQQHAHLDDESALEVLDGWRSSHRLIEDVFG